MSPDRATAAAGRALAALDRAVQVLVIAVTGAMVVVVVAQVALRYGLGQSFDWADEISRLLFVWVVFLALPLGIPKAAHVGVSLLTDRLSDRPRRLLFRLTSLMCAALLAVVAYQGALLAIDQWEEPLSTLDASVALFLVPLVFGCAHGVLHFLALAGSGAYAAPALVVE
ncbi:TRAP transporter small permease [Aquabacter spiritensis]|uniref:TRAP transporter small permease protein n=1 Tax=Aquabacter spiritensis TaxID=933073 RepID=A0A4V2UXK5_9HYPH|nr:TRAP transporter small permease subunit [Aquabacter spiritensis]TCT03908.1 TRAP-type C4-dicarboxylate transport system permease small subunit [Aquabacter spiritensis]